MSLTALFIGLLLAMLYDFELLTDLTTQSSRFYMIFEHDRGEAMTIWPKEDVKIRSQPLTWNVPDEAPNKQTKLSQLKPTCSQRNFLKISIVMVLPASSKLQTEIAQYTHALFVLEGTHNE
jgi:hypothetical protein